MTKVMTVLVAAEQAEKKMQLLQRRMKTPK